MEKKPWGKTAIYVMKKKYTHTHTINTIPVHTNRPVHRTVRIHTSWLRRGRYFFFLLFYPAEESPGCLCHVQFYEITRVSISFHVKKYFARRTKFCLQTRKPSCSYCRIFRYVFRVKFTVLQSSLKFF